MVTGTDRTRPRTIEGITRPDPRDHYGQILAWVVCWPWNLVWTVAIHNPFRYVCEFVLREIQSTLDEIATGEFSQIERDLDERPVAATVPVAAPSHRIEESEEVNRSADVTCNSTDIVPDTGSVETVSNAGVTSGKPAADRSDEKEEWSAASAFGDTQPVWDELLKPEAAVPQEATPAESLSGEPLPEFPLAENADRYTPPAMPPIPAQQDPWYYSPRGRTQSNGGPLTDRMPRNPEGPGTN